MPGQVSSPIDRRAFLTRGSLLAAGVAVATPFHALAARAGDRDFRGHGRARHCSPDYGPLAPVNDHTTGLPLLLPAGFEYVTFGSTSSRPASPWR